MKPFDTEAYLDAQIEAFQTRLAAAPKAGRVYIEFGGKPVDDQHAARVLPGYDPDVKVKLLNHLQLNQSVAIVVAVSARDLLRPRIRGDSQLFYNHETVALVRKLRAMGLQVDAGVVTMVDPGCSPEDRHELDAFIALAEAEIGLRFVEYPAIPGYPYLRHRKEWQVWDQSARLQIPDRHHVLVMSPGGGSGKFGVCVAELYRDYAAGLNSSYLKFETFPVFDLQVGHAVNRAFIAATADLGNTLSVEETGGTCYDKDVDNVRLLRRIHRLHCPEKATNPITSFERPSDFSVNRLTAGIVDEEAIVRAAQLEIERRRKRYEDEIGRGIEYTSTIQHLDRFAGEG